MEEEQIFRYLNGDTTQSEDKEVEAWLQGSAEHLEQFKKWQQIWEATSKIQVPDVEITKVWDNIDARTLNHAKEIFITTKAPKTIRQTWYYAAASVSILLLVGLWFWLGQFGKVEWHAQEITALRTLSDGTKVWLAPNSQLVYPEAFAGSTREVNLKGKAFFEVAKDTEKPFLVNGNETQIKVLGTQFMAINNASNEQVVLQEGKVAFYEKAKTEQQVILAPSEQAIFNKQKGGISKSAIHNGNMLAWKTKQLVFDATSLQEVFSLLEEVYNIQIEYDTAKFSACLLTASFNQEPIEQVWALLQTVYNIEVIKTDTTNFTIKGNGCND